ncbi:MAG TPA: winged helix-turn-helix domain-containing protein [Kaistia sp.]|jgi:hypothetical protein|nr:winged helix-turn-helix domain-containing protein [Kaistia sp.]
MSRRITNYLFPSNDRVQEALLLLLLEKGGELGALRASDTYMPLADFFSLAPCARVLTRAEYLNDGRNEAYWHTWVQWSRDRLLTNADLECPKRGFWKLTDKGRRRAEIARSSLLGTLPLFDGHSPTPITPVMLKIPSEITLDDLNIEI